MDQPPAAALLAPALEQQGGGGLGDDSLEVGNFFSIEAVIYGSEFFLGPLNGSLDRILVDFSLSKGAVGEDYDLGIGDLGKAGADGEGLGNSTVKVTQDTGLQRGDQTDVRWQDAQFSVHSGEINVFNRP